MTQSCRCFWKFCRTHLSLFMHVWERGRTVKILITTLGNKKEQMYFLFKTEQKKPKPKKSTAVAGQKSLRESCTEVLCARMTKWTMTHKSKRSAKKEWNRRVKIKHSTALSISSSLKALHASVCYFWLMQTSYSITYQINGKLRASKSLRTAGEGETSSRESKEEILGKKMLLKPCFWSLTTHPPWCDSLTNSITQATTISEVPFTLWRSGNMQREPPGRAQFEVWTSPWIPTRCRLQLRFPSLLMLSSSLFFLLRWASYP